VGLLLGASVAAVALTGWRVPTGAGALGLDIRFIAATSGELTVERPGAFVSGRGLVPGGAQRPAKGALHVTNVTGSLLRIRVRALPDSRDVDELVQVRLHAGGRALYEGELGGLRRATRRSFTLPSGGARTLRLRAWLPHGTGRGSEGRITDVATELLPIPVRG